jgi:hypothetical protein
MDDWRGLRGDASLEAVGRKLGTSGGIATMVTT